MKVLFDTLSEKGSEQITKKYSTSFSNGILFLDKELRQPIYNIYGLVRYADEIVDTFHDYDQEDLLHEFIEDTKKAIERKISLNPVLNAFQKTYHQYNIDYDLVDLFFKSMEMDLTASEFDEESYKDYILGSAEVVGLMCLKVFCHGEEKKYNELKPYAMKLGSAFQKINFLRDVKDDFENLGRTYFPNVENMTKLTESEKKEIEKDIHGEFEEALKGIKMLPKSSRRGVYLAFFYYSRLFKKIRRTPAQELLVSRIRIPNFQKLCLTVQSDLRVRTNTLKL